MLLPWKTEPASGLMLCSGLFNPLPGVTRGDSLTLGTWNARSLLPVDAGSGAQHRSLKRQMGLGFAKKRTSFGFQEVRGCHASAMDFAQELAATHWVGWPLRDQPQACASDSPNILGSPIEDTTSHTSGPSLDASQLSAVSSVSALTLMPRVALMVGPRAI